MINARCELRKEDDQRVVVASGFPVHHYHATDAVAEAYAMVFLVNSGFAQQNEVAKAFGCSDRTIRRHQGRYAEGGMTALATSLGWRQGRRRISNQRLRVIETLKSQGISNRQIAISCNIARSTVGEYLFRFQQAALNWPLPQDIDDNQLEQLLYPQMPAVPADQRPAPEQMYVTTIGKA